MRITGFGHALFAATLIAIGAWGLASGQFGAIWQPVPRATPAREILAYACAVVSLAAGLGLVWKRMAALAARLLVVWLLLWLVLFKARPILAAPAAMVSWENFAETGVILAGAWALYVAVAGASDKRLIGFAAGESGTRIARMLYGLGMIVFGLAHLAYLKQTAALVPRWLPAHSLWAEATGAAYAAAGAAILTGVLARLAAALSTLQMGLFTLLVWVPVLAAGSKDAAVWSEAFISLALTATGWVVADGYAGRPWFAGRRRRGAFR
jgi:uncharacterized membrane protein